MDHLQYHAVQQLPLKLEQQLLKRFQLLFGNGELSGVVVYRLQQPTARGRNHSRAEVDYILMQGYQNTPKTTK